MNTPIMSSYTDVKNLIISNIKANGQREITGPILQDVLLNMLENSSEADVANKEYVDNKIADIPIEKGTGENSVVQKGNNNTASGYGSFAEGVSIKALGHSSHAEGHITTALGDYSHAEGQKTQAKDSCSHAEGSNTIASGVAAHAEGTNTKALNYCSHAEGLMTEASGQNSHTEGLGTHVYNDSEHAEGKFNVSILHKTIHTVGIGEYEARKNAEEIHLNGDKYVYGIGGYDGTNSQTEGVEPVQKVVQEATNAVQITYAELKSLRGAGKLVPGTQYRITDYTCTTTQANTKSAGHVFDIIVTADDESTLNEVARAIKHEGDTYFANSDLSAWKIWYCLDNDTNRFAWADSANGKGVIYRMIDEFNNDVPYDFKNIQFYRQWDSSKSLWSTISSNNTGVPCYTFNSVSFASATSFKDYSLSSSNNVYSNVIKEYSHYVQMLNNNCFFGESTHSNSFDNNCYNNTFGNECYNNGFGYSCSSNAFRSGNNCNTFGSDCSNNTFGHYSSNNTLVNYCYYNTIGSNCSSNTFGNYCTYNTFGNYYSYNLLGKFSSYNTFGSNCSSNTFGNYCRYIKFASDSSATTKYSYYKHNHFGDGCQYIIFTGKDTGSDYQQVQNYNFAQGLQGTSSAYLTIDGKRNRAYETYVSKDTDGTIKESVIAEFENKLGNCVDLTSDQTITAVKTFSAGIDLNGTRISKVGSPINTDDAANKQYVDDFAATKQDVLTAGNGIVIDDNNTISINLDTDIFKVVPTLPEAPASGDENKIHLVLSSSSEEGNTYDEYIWVNNYWERIGSFRPSVDLSRYAEKSYVATQVKSIDDKVNDFKNAGYLYAGVATIDTNPENPDAKVFYIANDKGTYTNFGNIDVTEDEVVILYYDTEWHKVATGIASQEKLTELAHKGEIRHIERDLGMYPELEPVPLNSEVTGKYINSYGKYVDASDWNIASIGAVSLGNTYLLNMVSSANMVLGVALFVSRVYKRDKEGKIIGTTLTPLFSAKNTSIPASGYVLFEAMDDYEEVLICYKPELTTEMLVARWGFKASHATQLRNLRLIVDNKTDFEGIYELLTAGYALNLVGKGNGEPQAFLSRKTGGGNITDGSAVIKEVDGVQPIVWNKLIDTNAIPVSQTNSGVTISKVGDKIHIEGTATATFNFSFLGACKGLKQDHKYVFVQIGSTKAWAAVHAYGYPQFKEGGVIRTLGKVIGETFYISGNKGDTYNDDIKVALHDLTQMFGAGNEPSTYEEYLDRISHYHIEDTYAYNTGEVVNYKGTGIKTTGRNLWDEEWESGRLEKGENFTGPSHFRSKNFISVDPTKQYFIRATNCFVSEYDVNKTFIQQRSSFTNVAISLHANCRYIRFWCFNQLNYNHDICINLSDPTFNGQYEPYKNYVRDWSEVMKKYFPYGMTNLNGVKDFFNDKKATRKWGVVDLGSLSYSKNNNVWISIIPDYKTNTQNRYVNAFTAKYTQTIADNEITSVTCPNLKFYANAGGVAGGIGIRDDAYTTAESFKDAMAGVLLFYELSEPVEDIFEKPLNLTYAVINGGTETSLTTENSTQFEGSIAYNKDYVAVVDELQMQNRVIQIEFENWEN